MANFNGTNVLEIHNDKRLNYFSFYFLTKQFYWQTILSCEKVNFLMSIGHHCLKPNYLIYTYMVHTIFIIDNYC